MNWLLTPIPTAIPSPEEWLSEREQSVWKQFRFEKRRTEWLAGRWAAKKLLSRAFEGGQNNLEILAAPDGAPEVFTFGEKAPYSLSLSHRNGYVLAAVNQEGHPIGCDLEVIETRSSAFIEEFFTTEEQQQIRSSKEADKLAIVLWSAKESVLKVMRTGLRVSTNHIRIFLEETPETAIQWSFEAEHIGTGQRFSGWWRISGALVITFAMAGSGAKGKF
ncbi:MAG: 4'-phosphopantetheinyl transferase superfamily protein [Blastocatellia bacterium]|nr:4'-phosphopantetheinyl transferase superfamily protein [Blastocatellia bacterium]